MKSIVLLLFGPVFLFPATAQNGASEESRSFVSTPEISPEPKALTDAMEPTTPLGYVSRPIRVYREDTWVTGVLAGQVSDTDLINYLYEILTHHETPESVWEDALNALIYIKRKQESDSMVADRARRILLVLDEVLTDIDRTTGQRHDIMKITAGFESEESVTVLKNFVLSFHRLSDKADLSEEMELRESAIYFLEDIKNIFSIPALYDIALAGEETPVDLKIKALESLRDRAAYNKIRQIVVNTSANEEIRETGFHILEEAEALSQIKEVAMASSPQGGHRFGFLAVEVLGEHQAVRSLNEIASDSSVSDPIQESALLQLLAMRKARQDRRLNK